MPDEEALLVVVGVDEPARDPVRSVASDFTGVRVKHVDPVDLDLELLGVRSLPLGLEDVDVGFAEDDEEIPLAGVLEVVCHVEIGVHARLEDRDTAESLELRGVRLVVEGTRDENVETPVGRLVGRGHQVRSRYRAEFRPDEDRRALLGPAFLGPFHVSTFSADELARPRRD